MSLKTIFQSDIQAIEADFDNVTFNWQGEDYLCHVSGDTVDATLEVGGFSVTADKVLVVRTNVFTDSIFPKQTQQLTFDSKTYRIDKVIKNANSAFLRLVLTDVNRGV